MNFRHSLSIGFFATLATIIHANTPPNWPSNYPDWWYDAANPAHGVIDATQPVLNQNNDAVLNQGQLWNMAEKGIAELGSVGGAGFDLSTFIESGSTADYFAPVNLGQLKNVSSKFYDRFAEIGFGPTSQGWPDGMTLFASTGYPWALNQTPDNYNLANIGQAKFLFSWSLPPLTILQFLKDSDGDGLNDGFETAFGSDPNLVDTDLDGTTDLLEERLGLDPLFQELDVDADGDRFPNKWELWAGTDASDASDYPTVSGLLPNAPNGEMLYIVDDALLDDSLPYDKKRIQAAADILDDGDLVAIRPGTYIEQISIPKGLEDIAVIALDGGGTIGDIIIDAGGGSGADAFRVEGDNAQTVNAKSTRILLDGLTIQGASAIGRTAFYSKRIRGVVRNCIFRDSSQGILQSETISCIYENCVVINNSGQSAHAGALVSRGYTNFLNCIFYKNRFGSFYNQAIACRNAANVYFRNTIIWNDKSDNYAQVYAGDSYTDVYFTNTILREGNGAITKDYNSTFHYVTPLIDADPFLSAEGRPLPGSSAIAFPDTEYAAPNYDLDGLYRYLDKPDLGAYEYTGITQSKPIESVVAITVNSSVAPIAVTLDASNSTILSGVVFQAFWDLDGDGNYDLVGSSITDEMLNLIGNLIRFRLLNSKGEEVIQTIDFRDSDGDGLPDFWELENFGHLSATDTDDTDLDGIDNLNEFHANSDPLDNSAGGLGLLVHNL